MNDLTLAKQHQGLIVQLEVTTDPEAQLELMQQVGSRLAELGDLREDIEIMEAEIYYTINRLWENGHIQEPVKEAWDNDFYKWAAEFALKGRQQISPVTIDNKARVFKMWMSPESTIAPPPTVYLSSGEGSDEYEEVTFDIHRVPYSKLLVATGAANRGDMNEEAWAALMNPSATVTDLKAELYKARMAVEDEAPKWPESIVFNGEGILYYRQGDMTVAFAQLLYENSENPLFASAANRLLQMYGLDADQSLKVELPEGNQTSLRPLMEEGERVGVQLTHRGRVFADFTMEEASSLLVELSDFLELWTG